MKTKAFLVSFLAAASLAAAAPETAAPKSIAQMRKEADTAFNKRQYAVARELAATVRAATNATPADFCWAWKMEAGLLEREGKRAEARQMYEKLFNVVNPVDAVYSAAKTFTGRDAPRALTYLEGVLEGNPGRCPLTEKERIGLWDRYAWEAYGQFDPERMRKGREKSLALGGRGGLYPGWISSAIKMFDDFKSFPLDEKDVKFAKTLEDFGIKVDKTVHVAKDFGFDPVNSTRFIQAAVTSGAQRVVLENVGKPWYVRSIRLLSNIELVLQKGVRVHTDRTWEQFTSGNTTSSLFLIHKCTNVVIRGEAENDHDAVISQFHDMMDRAKNCRDYGRSDISISDSRHVAVRNLRISDSAEDAIMFGGMNYSGDMYFENLDLDSCFRQATSPCNLDRGFFRHVRFRNTAGAEPGAGIDLEPAEVCQANSSIYLYDCTFDNNLGGGLLFSTSSMFPISVHAKRCVFKPNRQGDLMVFIRAGIYLDKNKKVPGKAIFEDCVFECYADVAPIRIDGHSLLDLEFRNCTIKDTGELLDRGDAPDAPAVLFNLNHDVYYTGSPDDPAEATVSFENCRIIGYTNAPPVAFKNHAGHVSIRNIKGVVDFNGQKVDLASFRHAAPDRAFQDIERKIPDLSGAESATPPGGKGETAFCFRWDGAWFDPRPEIAYLLRGEKGAKARLLIRLLNLRGDKAIRLVGPDGAATELGEYRQGDNEIAFSFPETGWYCLRPPANHVLVAYEGVSPVYFGGMGKRREIQIDAPLGYVGYFEVPAKGVAPFKVEHGGVKLRDATGADAGVVSSGRFTGAGYAQLKSKSGKPEVWSFQMEGAATIKFFAPFTGLWADTPEAVPASPGAVRPPVVKIERKVMEEKEETPATDLKSYLAAHPVIAQIVKDETAARLEWARKGEYTALLKEKEAQLEKMRENVANEQQQKEIADLEKNLPPLRERADMEKRIPAMTPDELERHAFCQAFAVVYGFYYDKTVGGNFLRCLRDHDDMPAKYPHLYWWVYKRPYDEYIRRWLSEFGLGFRDFTFVCDDDKKLDKLIPVLQKYLDMIME